MESNNQDKEERQRTLKQNNALHKLFELIAGTLNEAGLDIPTLLIRQPIADIPWSKNTVKDILWRRMQIDELGKVSTTALTTKEIDLIYDTLNRYLAKEGIHEMFPSIKELMHQQRTFDA